MQTGYLFLQTHTDHPDLVRLQAAQYRPMADQEPTAEAIRYIARFRDIDAARMHFHNALARTLVDIDSGLYRVPLADAIATIEASDLRHERIWLDPDLPADTLQQVKALTGRRHRRQDRSRRIWNGIGLLALLWLLFNALSSLH